MSTFDIIVLLKLFYTVKHVWMFKYLFVPLFFLIGALSLRVGRGASFKFSRAICDCFLPLFPEYGEAACVIFELLEFKVRKQFLIQESKPHS